MRNYFRSLILLITVLLSARTYAIPSDGVKNIEQDSASVQAAHNFTNFCAACHHDDLSWFANRKWKYGNSKNDIATSITTGYPGMGMVSFKKTFSEQQIKELAQYIHSSLDLIKEEHGIELLDKNRIPTERLNLRLDTIITGLNVPWGMVFLPGGDMLVTEREGKMIRYRKGQKIAEIRGLPEIQSVGQGGLLDITLHPNYRKNGWIYFAYTSAFVSKDEGWGATFMRAKLKNNTLIEKQLLFKSHPESKAGYNVGCRITFDGKGHIFFSVGDRGQPENAQNLTNDWGKIHRLNEDGTVPNDNPFVNQAGAGKSIWSYGHRNPQGLVYNFDTGILWESEHGPKGGDEINVILPGKNYGWPVITYGINYDGTIITRDTAKVGMEQPITYWVPSIAPCGMTFVSGKKYIGWEGNILLGSLRFKYLVRCEMGENKVIHQEILFPNIGRLRNVVMGPDGYIYIAIETPGMIFRLVPVP